MDIDEARSLAVEVVHFNPRGMTFRSSDARAVLKASGRTLTEMIGDDADLADKMQSIAFVELRKRIRGAQEGALAGYDYPDPGELWAIAEEMDVATYGDEVPTPDPLNATSSST